ncbi:MAG: hypothetical protein AB1728_04050 [Bacteroidota bacterium]
MHTQNVKIILSSILLLSFSGCYTVLMSPQEFLQSRDEHSSTYSDASFQLNYNRNCLSCHSRAELDDRYLELKYYGVTSVHNGIILEPTAWNNPYVSPVYEPDPYGWYNPVPAQPWWFPPATSVSGGEQPKTATANNNRPRTTGSTRDNTGSRERSQSNPAPTQATPSQSGTGTTTTQPSTPPPATTTAPPPATQTPAASTTSGERSRTDTKPSDSGSRTRDSGSSRDGNRPR